MPIRSENLLPTSQILPGGLGPDGLIEYTSMQAFLESQKGSGGKLSLPEKPNKPGFFSRRIDSLLIWLKGWIPPEPTEIVAPLDTVFKLDSEIRLANSAQTGHKFESQEEHDRKARQLLEETGFDQIYQLKPGIAGLQLVPRKSFEGRLARHNLWEREQAVIQVAPKLKK